MAKSVRSNSFESTMAVDAPEPENERQRGRRTGGGGVTIHDTSINQSEQEVAKAEASVASGVDVVESDEPKEAKKEKKGARR